MGREGLSNLQYLEFVSPDTCTKNMFIMPLNSAMTLTHLQLDFFPNPTDPYGATSLDVFVNLTVLNIDPLSSDICDAIIRADFRLTLFRAVVDEDLPLDSNMIVTMVSARSLTTVKKFIFKFDKYLSYNLTHFKSFVEAFTTNMVSIELLDLNMGLDLSWCPIFARLVKLREFYYKVDMEKYEDSDFDDGVFADYFPNANSNVQHNNSIQISYYCRRGIQPPDITADKAFILAFQHFINVPSILIEIRRLDDYYSEDEESYYREEFQDDTVLRMSDWRVPVGKLDSSKVEIIS